VVGKHFSLVNVHCKHRCVANALSWSHSKHLDHKYIPSRKFVCWSEPKAKQRIFACLQHVPSKLSFHQICWRKHCTECCKLTSCCKFHQSSNATQSHRAGCKMSPAEPAPQFDEFYQLFYCGHSPKPSCPWSSLDPHDLFYSFSMLVASLYIFSATIGTQPSTQEDCQNLALRLSPVFTKVLDLNSCLSTVSHGGTVPTQGWSCSAHSYWSQCSCSALLNMLRSRILRLIWTTRFWPLF